MALFTVGDETNHHVGDRQCAECWEDYPEPCPCGGLVHAVGSEDEDLDGNIWLVTACDRCGLSEEELEARPTPPA